LRDFYHPPTSFCLMSPVPLSRGIVLLRHVPPLESSSGGNVKHHPPSLKQSIAISPRSMRNFDFLLFSFHQDSAMLSISPLAAIDLFSGCGERPSLFPSCSPSFCVIGACPRQPSVKLGLVPPHHRGRDFVDSPEGSFPPPQRTVFCDSIVCGTREPSPFFSRGLVSLTCFFHFYVQGIHLPQSHPSPSFSPLGCKGSSPPHRFGRSSNCMLDVDSHAKGFASQILPNYPAIFPTDPSPTHFKKGYFFLKSLLLFAFSFLYTNLRGKR